MKNLNWKGVPGLVTRELQQLNNDPSELETLFEQLYVPAEDFHEGYPLERVDFEGGAYSVYNWELFFHAPLLIATRLSQERKFQEAQNWFHLIFNPTTNDAGDAPQRYWITRPFFENSNPEKEHIVAVLRALHSSDSSEREKVKSQIEQWRDNPFKPHLIARLRITAYQKTVVMKYIDNLVQWGDALFRRDTIESINEATQLFVLAYRLLGRRPQEIPRRIKKGSGRTYAELQPELDEFSNALVEFENEFPFTTDDSGSSETGATTSDGLGRYTDFYFCIPGNEKLLGYWDTVEDRLFKIRHCLNIEGIARPLPLFEPPIDPALLVRATAMGLDISSVLSDISAPLPPYRFQALVQKAVELCQELKSSGGALLAALEKKDAEELAVLRTGQELALLKAAREVRRGQLQETEAAIEALRKTRDVVEARRRFYENTLSAGLNFHEKDQLDRLKAANDKQGEALNFELTAQGTSQIPNATAGASGWSSPVVTAQFGGSNISSANAAYARYLSGQASDETYFATKSSIMGGHKRREEDWRHQKSLAEKELIQIDKQIVAAEIRRAVAEIELLNHDKQIENSEAVNEFMREKYTNQELYGWMAGQISSVFHETYKLAYDLAKRAERAYRFERGLTASNFIQFGHWDSARKGFLSGERLALDLKRMEAAYMDQNRREYEITTQVSLAALDPEALLALKEIGRCRFKLPEALYDLEYPGHYMRRIRSVNLTIPCVIGPYTGVHATLTLLSSTIRADPNSQRPYESDNEGEDPRFIRNFGALQSIATSHAQNDNGMFELNFKDERYLPFEGAGTDSQWQLDMLKATNAFDLNTVTDVILKISYTAREGGEVLRQKALERANLPKPEPQFPSSATSGMKLPMQTNSVTLLSVKHEFSNQWHKFLNPLDTETTHTLALDLMPAYFPFRFRNSKNKINRVDVFLKLKEGVTYEDGNDLKLTWQGKDTILKVESPLNLPHGIPLENGDETLGAWTVTITEANLKAAHPDLWKKVTINGQERCRLDPDAIEDLLLLVRYTVPEG
ncbi:MAG TPA: hypothetical protein VN708_26450 [Terriglobales bacterium]|nr:hypothetical protein [Terriglobales bacterium]